jgi:hypothetical protein
MEKKIRILVTLLDQDRLTEIITINAGCLNFCRLGCVKIAPAFGSMGFSKHRRMVANGRKLGGLFNSITFWWETRSCEQWLDLP